MFIHRDLKPSNVLIDTSNQPRITDFGIAKALTTDSGLTLTGEILGSPGYAAPEQTGGRSNPVGPPSDVYSIGALLYHLMTGRPPFLANTPSATLRLVFDQEPVPPRQLNPSVPKDLETLCLKCLEKDPARRFATADQLAADLGRFLRNEPIHARSVHPLERGWHWCRRKPVVASLGAGLVFALVTVAVVSSVAAFRISAVRADERRETYHLQIATAKSHIDQGSIDQALELLAGCSPDHRHWEWGYLVYLCHQYTQSIEALPSYADFYRGGFQQLTFAPDGKTIAWVDNEGAAVVFDLDREQEWLSVGGPSNRAGCVSFSVKGCQLFVGFHTGQVIAWSVDDWKPSFTSEPTGAAVVHLVNATPDPWVGWPSAGRLAVAYADGVIQIHEPARAVSSRPLDLPRAMAVEPDLVEESLSGAGGGEPVQPSAAADSGRSPQGSGRWALPALSLPASLPGPRRSCGPDHWANPPE